jgi:hypothetical protein
MLRVKDLPKTIDVNKQKVADFFGIDIKLVNATQPSNTYFVDLSTNTDAQAKYKTINKYGNGTGRPGQYNFSEPVMIYYNDSGKVQAM